MGILFQLPLDPDFKFDPKNKSLEEHACTPMERDAKGGTKFSDDDGSPLSVMTERIEVLKQMINKARDRFKEYRINTKDLLFHVLDDLDIPTVLQTIIVNSL